MDFKYILFALMGLALAVDTSGGDANMDDQIEDSTVSPIAELALIDSELKTSTERPPTVATTAQNNTTVKSEQSKDAQPHTVADFIIHPLIAFKPHSPEENVSGKQAGDSSSTTPSPWTLFGFTAGQGLGSSVSSLAGSVSGWLTDRIQLPGLVDSPVRESTSTSTTTTTTTTQRPDVIVRVQHKATTRRPPLISINNQNRPQRFHNNNNIGLDEEDDEDLNDQFEEEEDIVRNKNKRRNNKKNYNKRRPNFNEEDIDDAEEDDDRPVSRPQRKRPQQKRRPVVEDELSEEEDDESLSAELDDEDDENFEEEEGDENDDEEEEEYTNQRPLRRRQQINNNNRLRQQQQRHRQKSGGIRRIAKPTEDEEIEEDAVNEHFYYGSQSGRPSTKRSQNEATFFQRGQQNIIKQLRQLTRGRTPAEIGALVSKSQKQAGSKETQPQKATLLINRNGQTVYLAPELLNDDLPLVNPQYLKEGATQFPQPPLSKPLKRKDAPTQYITIPWSKLGISPPDQLQAVAEGVQTQPLILNIPASAIQTMQNQSQKRKKQPVITAEAVPLLAEASIMDIFKPPKIPNDRHTTNLSTQKPSSAGMPVIIASKTKPSAGSNTIASAILPQRIRPGTIVEKAPATADSQQEASEEMYSQQTVRKVENQYILVGEDSEPGLTRQVKPVYGEARHGYGANRSPYLELLKHGHFALHRSGRELELPKAGESTDTKVQQSGEEKLIPVQIINEPEEVTQPKEVHPPVESQQQSEPQIAQSEPQLQVQQPVLEGAGVAT